MFADVLHARMRHSSVDQRVIALRMLIASSAQNDRKMSKLAGWDPAYFLLTNPFINMCLYKYHEPAIELFLGHLLRLPFLYMKNLNHDYVTLWLKSRC